jgi:hypothetical protein
MKQKNVSQNFGASVRDGAKSVRLSSMRNDARIRLKRISGGS